jgi:uncharacterized membrane protein YbhN (UPF0104 family)
LAQEQSGKPKSPVGKILTQALRAALAVAPLVWIYTRADAAALGENLASVSAALIAAILALLFANMLLQGVKWWTLIRRFVPGLKVGRAVSVHLGSAFYSIVLPAAAQDVVKSVMLSKNHPPSVIWAASWLARLIGFFSLLIFSAAGLMYLDSGILPDGFRASLLTAVAAITALGAASFSKSVTRPLRSLAARILSPGILAKAEKLREGIYVFKYERATLAQTFLISSLVQFLSILSAALTAYAVSGNFYFIECLAFVPLVEIMAVSLPLTPGGLGIREALMAILFTRLGLDGGQIASYVTISLIGSMVRILGGIPILWRLVRGSRIKVK